MSFRFFDLRGFTKKVFNVIAIFVSVCNNPVMRNDTALDAVSLFVDRCSNGVWGLNTTVFPFTVQIPCGVQLGCDTDTWARLTDATVNTYNTNTDFFDHKIYLIPRGICSFAGLGDVGPGLVPGNPGLPGLRIFIPDDKLGIPSVFLHELGHNWGLVHSGYNGIEYGDLSSAMGWCCDTRCFNGMEEYTLGWSQPVTTVTQSGNYTLNENEYILLDGHFVQYRKNKIVESLNEAFHDILAVYYGGAGATATANEVSAHQEKPQLLDGAKVGVGVSDSDSERSERLQFTQPLESRTGPFQIAAFNGLLGKIPVDSGQALIVNGRWKLSVTSKTPSSIVVEFVSNW